MEVSGRRTEGSFKDTVGESSAEDGEVFCQPCCSGGDWVIAVGYCRNCNEYFCAGCLTVHRKQAITRNHTIAEGKKMSTMLSKSVSLDACSELCTKHTNEILKFYCSTHDAVGCSDCMVLDHKACQIERIADISNSYFNGSEHNELQMKVDKFLRDMNQVDKEMETNEKYMQKAHAKLVDDINTFRKEINDYLDVAEKDILSKLNERKQADENLRSKLKENEKVMIKDIETLQEKLQLQVNQGNELFVAAKVLKAKMRNADDFVKQMLTEGRVKLYQFDRSSEITKMITSRPKLGELFVKKNIEEMEAKYDGEIGIKALDDISNCCVSACKFISPHQLILTDSENTCVKIVDTKQQKLLEKFKLSSSPWGVAVVSHYLTAVSLPTEEKIQFLIITQNSKLTKSHDIKVNGCCKGIACYKDKLVVEFKDHIEILSVNGQLQKTITVPNCKHIRSIAFAHDANTFYVSNSSTYDSAIYKLDLEGNILAVGSSSMPIRGVCVIPDDTVLLCNWTKTGSISVFSNECRKIRDIIKQNKHVSHPAHISYCDENNRLFLCNTEYKLDPKMKNVIKIFQLK